MSAADLDKRFQDAVQRVKEWKPSPKEPSSEEKLEIYALFKQATVGDCNVSKYV